MFFKLDATSCPEHVSEVEDVWRKGSVFKLDVERDESDTSQGIKGEAGGQAVASSVVSQETQVIGLMHNVQNNV